MKWQTMRRLMATAIVMAGAGTTGSAVAQDSFDAEDYFGGETVTMVYNASPGGTTHLSSQTFANHWGKHIPGNPEVITQSVPGGNLTKGIVAVQTAKPDGLTVSWVAWNGATRALEPPETRIPFEEFGLIGGGGFGGFVHARADLGGGITEDPTNLMKADRIVYGGYRPAGTYDVRMRLSLELLGLDYQYVSGFAGGAPAFAAMLRDEITMHTPSVADYVAIYKEGAIAEGQTAPLFYWARQLPDGTEAKKPQVPDMMTFREFYEAAKGEEPSGPKYDAINIITASADDMTWFIAAPPGTPDNILQVLRDSFAATVEDPEYIAEMVSHTKAMPTLLTYEDAQKVVYDVQNIDPAVADVIRDSIERASQ